MFPLLSWVTSTPAPTANVTVTASTAEGFQMPGSMVFDCSFVVDSDSAENMVAPWTEL